MINSPLVQTIFIKTWRPYFWIAISSFLLYGHIIFFSEYTHYDDHFLIVGNYSKIANLSDIGRQFFEDVGHLGQGGSLYRPMLNVSFILSAQISGTNTWGHHLLNILLHIGTCVFLFILLLNLGVSRSISFLSSVLFTIHPALTQSIAYISGRNDSLLAFFILPCFIAFLKFLSSSSYKWYLLHLLFFALALFTKETTIVFPVISLFYVFFVYNRKTSFAQITGLIVAWIVVFVNWYLLRMYAQITQLTSPIHVLKILCSDFWIVFFYFGKILLPYNLTFGPLDVDLNIVPGILSALFLIGIIALSQNRNWRIILFGLLWFGLFLVPTFVYNTNKVEYHIPYYEHRIYVPMIGIVLLLTSLSFSKRIFRSRSSAPILLGIIIVFLSWKSYRQTFHFQNFLTLRQYAAETSPHDRWQYTTIERMSLPVALKQLIQDYKFPSDAPPIDLEESNSPIQCRRTRDILQTLENKYPREQSNEELLHALAITNFARGFVLRAEELFISAKNLDPQNPIIPFNLGILYYNAHRYKQAEQEWLSTLKLNPAFGNAYLDLTYLYYEQGQFEQAWTNCQLTLAQGVSVPEGLVHEIKNNLQVRGK